MEATELAIFKAVHQVPEIGVWFGVLFSMLFTFFSAFLATRSVSKIFGHPAPKTSLPNVFIFATLVVPIIFWLANVGEIDGALVPRWIHLSGLFIAAGLGVGVVRQFDASRPIRAVLLISLFALIFNLLQLVIPPIVVDRWLPDSEFAQHTILWRKSERGRAFGRIADVKSQHGENSDAIVFYEAAYALNPENPFYLANASLDLVKVGDCSSAEESLRKSGDQYRRNLVDTTAMSVADIFTKSEEVFNGYTAYFNDHCRRPAVAE